DTLEKQLAEVEKSSRLELEALKAEREILLKERHQSDIPKEIEQQLHAIQGKTKSLTDERDRKIADAEERARKSREFWQREKMAAHKANDVERELEATRKLNAANGRAERTRLEAEYQRKLGDAESEEKKLLDKRVGLVVQSEEAVRPRLSELSRKEQEI